MTSRTAAGAISSSWDGLSRRCACPEHLHRSCREECAGSPTPQPPVEAYFRVIDAPVIRLVSTDLGRSQRLPRSGNCSISLPTTSVCSKGLLSLQGLSPKHGGGQPIASGYSLSLAGPGLGIRDHESVVNNIPKGSTARRLDNPPCVDHHHVACVQQGRQQTLRVRSRTVSAGRLPPVRSWGSAQRVGRRVAGFRRHLARNEAHSGCPSAPG